MIIYNCKEERKPKGESKKGRKENENDRKNDAV